MYCPFHQGTNEDQECYGNACMLWTNNQCALTMIAGALRRSAEYQYAICNDLQAMKKDVTQKLGLIANMKPL